MCLHVSRLSPQNEPKNSKKSRCHNTVSRSPGASLRLVPGEIHKQPAQCVTVLATRPLHDVPHATYIHNQHRATILAVPIASAGRAQVAHAQRTPLHLCTRPLCAHLASAAHYVLRVSPPRPSSPSTPTDTQTARRACVAALNRSRRAAALQRWRWRWRWRWRPPALPSLSSPRGSSQGPPSSDYRPGSAPRRRTGLRRREPRQV